MISLSESFDSSHDQFFKLLGAIKLIVFDFDGVFTDNSVYVSEDGTETVRCSRSDGIGLARIRDCGVSSIILSTESNPVVSVRAKKLNINCLYGVGDKGEQILKISKELKIELNDIAFMGNDINDIPALRLVGVPIAVGDAYPEILKYVLHQTVRNGGRGAVREICDLIFHVKNFEK